MLWVPAMIPTDHGAEFEGNSDLYLPSICGAYRSLIHKSIACTTNSVIFGSKVWAPVDLIYSIREQSLASCIRRMVKRETKSEPCLHSECPFGPMAHQDIFGTAHTSPHLC